jgi:hypothetical protein
MVSETSNQSSELITPSKEQLNERLTEAFAEVAEGVRVFSQSQVDIWRQLPYLALQADGNGGFSHINSKLYRYGMLHIAGDSEGLWGTFIDCDNGNILSLKGKPELDSLATDREVLEAWLPEGKNFNAQRYLEHYQAAAVVPYKSYSADSENQIMEWRYDITRKLGLSSIFRRAQPISRN